MGRDVLRVDGVTPSTKKLLQEQALKRFGKPNASLMIRHLVAKHLTHASSDGPKSYATVEQHFDELKVRVELRLPKSVEAELARRAELHLSDRNHYIATLLYSDIGRPQLLGDQIETLRSSNYELAKIGTNLNQMTKALNILVKKSLPSAK